MSGADVLTFITQHSELEFLEGVPNEEVSNIRRMLPKHGTKVYGTFLSNNYLEYFPEYDPYVSLCIFIIDYLISHNLL
jgi:hypothetical protein